MCKSNLAILCNELAHDNLITKSKDPLDSRAICYNLTAQGQQMLDGVVEKIKNNFENELAYKNNIKQIETAVNELFELVK